MQWSRVPWQGPAIRMIAWVAVASVSFGDILLFSHVLSSTSTPVGAAGPSAISTLVPLFGDVELQQGATWTTVTADVAIHDGDHVRTGPDSYAVVNYFDGSMTEIDPNSSLAFVMMDPLPNGGKVISFAQEAGASWNRVQKLVGAASRFDTVLPTAVAFVQGTEYRVRVDPDKQAVVEAVTDNILVQSTIEDAPAQVVLSPGFQSLIGAGETPSPPSPAPLASFGVRLEINGQMTPLFTDDRNRTIGFQPQSGAYVNQMPGAQYAVANGEQAMEIPDPRSRYDLVLTGQPGAGAFTVRAAALSDGAELTGPHATDTTGGAARAGVRYHAILTVDRDNQTVSFGPWTQLNNAPGGSGAGPSGAAGPLTPTSTIPAVNPRDLLSSASAADGASNDSAASATPTTITPTATPLPASGSPTLTGITPASSAGSSTPEATLVAVDDASGGLTASSSATVTGATPTPGRTPLATASPQSTPSPTIAPERSTDSPAAAAPGDPAAGTPAASSPTDVIPSGVTPTDVIPGPSPTSTQSADGTPTPTSTQSADGTPTPTSTPPLPGTPAPTSTPPLPPTAAPGTATPVSGQSPATSTPGAVGGLVATDVPSIVNTVIAVVPTLIPLPTARATTVPLATVLATVVPIHLNTLVPTLLPVLPTIAALPTSLPVIPTLPLPTLVPIVPTILHLL